MEENEISYRVRGAIFKVYNNLGLGLLESVYEAALKHELLKDGMIVQTQLGVPVFYDNINLDLGFRIDLKSVETLAPVHHKQLLTYLRLTNKKFGLLVNFNSENITDNITRIVNNQ